MNLDVIGLAGIKRSGKDTAARALWLAGYVRVAFADALRDEVFAKYPEAKSITDEGKEKPQKFLGGRSLREILIEIGMKRRESDPDYWVRILRQRIVKLRDSGKRVVVSDVRMPNEYTMLHEFGARLIWIKRAGIEPGDHPTERDHSGLCDIVIHNFGTPGNLQRKVLGVIGAAAGRGRCGACANFKADSEFAAYGFCGKIDTVGDRFAVAKVVSIATECQGTSFEAIPNLVPPAPLLQKLVEPRRAA